MLLVLLEESSNSIITYRRLLTSAVVGVKCVPSELSNVTYVGPPRVLNKHEPQLMYVVQAEEQSQSLPLYCDK